LNKE